MSSVSVRKLVASAAAGLVLALGAVASSSAASPTDSASSPAAAERAVVLRRFALVTGASEGGSGRVKLRYAATDAQAMQHVLSELGGLAEANTIVVLETDRAALRRGFERLRAMVAAASSTPGSRTEIVFYYSGHSDEVGLLLGSERVTYQELRAWVDQTGADVRIAVLDSCASGALTRSKGGVRRPPFLVDTSSAARGHAYLTASAEDEAAQESDRLGAAYFTHYLVSGLRGAADVSHDGRVTLSEAYQYAFTETLARTETSRGGPQHASYDFQLSGKGDLVMTDLHGTSATLLLPPEMSGRLFVRDARGQLVAEVHKLAAQPIELGLPPGRYRVTLDDDHRLSEASVELRAGQQSTLSRGTLVALAPVPAVSRGNAPASPDAFATATAGDGAAAGAPPPHHIGNLSLFPGVDSNGGVPSDNELVLGVVARSASLRGLSLTGVHYTDGDVHGVQIGYLANSAGGDLYGLQIDGMLAFGRRSVHGAQVAGLTAWAMGPLAGLQIGGLVDGAAGGKGLQLSGIANISTADFTGMQLTGIANFNRGRVRGAQVSGIANAAERLEGVQLSVVNIGGDVVGGQIGVINVARHVRGLQLGVVNVAETVDDGASVGLVTFVKEGIHEVDLSVSDVGAPVLSTVLGSRRIFMRLGAGVLAASDDIPGLRAAGAAGVADRGHFLVQWGFGGRVVARDRWFVDAEAVGTNFYRSGSFHQEDAVNGSLHVLAGYRLAPPLTLVAGPTYTAAVGYSGTDLATGHDFAEAVFRDGGTTVRLFPGLMLGLRVGI